MMGIYVQLKWKECVWGGGREVRGLKRDSRMKNRPRLLLRLLSQQCKWPGWWRRTDSTEENKESEHINKTFIVQTLFIILHLILGKKLNGIHHYKKAFALFLSSTAPQQSKQSHNCSNSDAEDSNIDMSLEFTSKGWQNFHKGISFHCHPYPSSRQTHACQLSKIFSTFYFHKYAIAF